MNYPAAPGGSAKIYVANPFGFSEAGRKFILEVILPELGKHGQAVDPFQLIDPQADCEHRKHAGGEDRIRAWRVLNAEIGELNQSHIDDCDVVFAVFDGVDVDSGAAAEIGYAYARGKLMIGYHGDFRLSADSEGGIVNLQVEHFIRASGGTITRKFLEPDRAFPSTS